MIPGAGALRLIQLATVTQNRGISSSFAQIFQLSELNGGSLGPKANFAQNSQEGTTLTTGLGYVYMARRNAM